MTSGGQDGSLLSTILYDELIYEEVGYHYFPSIDIHETTHMITGDPSSRDDIEGAWVLCDVSVPIATAMAEYGISLLGYLFVMALQVKLKLAQLPSRKHLADYLHVPVRKSSMSISRSDVLDFQHLAISICSLLSLLSIERPCET